MKTFSLVQFTENEFEEFCYDLLAAMGATRINWRKGTGLDASPADQGRDIECFFDRKDIDGHTISERWFIECKHYQRGVPPEKLQGILTWASAERPDVVLIIASEFLSNPAKHFLEAYQRNNQPLFKIKIWERPDLEKLCLGKPLLLRKYGMGGEFEFLNILHPAHVRYLRMPPINSLDYFFALLDKLSPEELGHCFFGAFISIINPEFDKPTDIKRQSLGDLAKGKVNYALFREKCYKLAQEMSPHYLVQAIVSQQLSATFNSADKTTIQETRERMKLWIAHSQEELRKPNRDVETIEKCIAQMTEHIENIEERTDGNYESYRSLCEKVVAPLFEEIHPSSKWVLEQMERDARGE